MKPINQTHDFCTCIGGYTLPKYSLYGDVYHTKWYTINFTPITRDGRDTYEIWVFCPSKKHPETGYFSRTNTAAVKNGGAIYVRIRDFIKSADFINETPVKCEHRAYKARELAELGTRAEREHARNEARRHREDMEGAPYLRKVNNNFTPTRDVYYELAVKNGARVNDPGAPIDDVMLHIPKDHMKNHVSKYRPEDTRPMVAGYAPKSGTLKESRIQKILAGDADELHYYLVNTQKVDKRVERYIKDTYRVSDCPVWILNHIL